ncbi:redoxin domain-containing protein [Brevibacterium sp. 5221]|uniref:Redoxin domain-containing protein n=1 Tax=Brevibacterium rongguiense TaxID=2695267 RepID=A0A6N9H4R5_9MICO|nr:redoxin domain-containing protein [Brevibacterium rongguiense]
MVRADAPASAPGYAAPAPAPAPAPGDDVGDAPAGTGPGSAGSDAAGGGARPARSALIVFYPFAFSPVCGEELGELTARHADFAAAGCGLAGISCDPKFALAAWARELGAPFPLLSDFWPHGAVARSYGAFDDARGMAVRATFLVAAGRIVASQVLPAGARRDFAPWLESARAVRP